jgi:hypothetical protein
MLFIVFLQHANFLVYVVGLEIGCGEDYRLPEQEEADKERTTKKAY